jgi:UDP-glucose 4-epimerase
VSAQKVLLTGGAGFIGSHVCRAFKGAGHEVLVLDNLSSGRAENLPEGVPLHELDVRSEEAAELVVNSGATVICHHAAQIDVRRSVTDPRFDLDVNVGGLLNLLEAARRGSVRQVIFASTGGAIYGDTAPPPSGEDAAAEPISPYGVAKLSSERYLYFYHRQYGLDVVNLRYSNVYGPRQSPHGEAGVVAIFIGRLNAGETLAIYGDGEQTRDYVYAGDVARANLAAIGCEGFRTYNVGTGVETSVNALYDCLREVRGGGPEAVLLPARPGEQARSAISPSKIGRELGVKIETGLGEGLALTNRSFSE